MAYVGDNSDNDIMMMSISELFISSYRLYSSIVLYDDGDSNDDKIKSAEV